MSSSDSVSEWLLGVKRGESTAAQRLWERYFDRLVHLARKKLAGAKPRTADEEDIALSAFDSFCRAARKNRFTSLKDRDGLWRLLIQMTAQKAVDQLRREARRPDGTLQTFRVPHTCRKCQGFARVAACFSNPSFRGEAPNGPGAESARPAGRSQPNVRESGLCAVDYLNWAAM